MWCRSKAADPVTLLQAALILLEDGCPPERRAYYCAHTEDFDETLCARCWSCYLYSLANREDAAAQAARMTRPTILD